MLNFNTTPDSRRGLSFSAGVSAGYLVDSRNKQISSQRGKQKYSGDFNLEPWRLAAIGEIGLGPVRLYGSYSINRLQQAVTLFEQFHYAVCIRFSNCYYLQNKVYPIHFFFSCLYHTRPFSKGCFIYHRYDSVFINLIFSELTQLQQVVYLV